jgi:hypothetical protein
MAKKLKFREPLYILADGRDELGFSLEQAVPKMLKDLTRERQARVQLWRTFILKGSPAFAFYLVRQWRLRGVDPAFAPPIPIYKRGLLHLLEQSFRYGWSAWGKYKEKPTIPVCDRKLCWEQVTPSIRRILAEEATMWLLTPQHYAGLYSIKTQVFIETVEAKV